MSLKKLHTRYAQALYQAAQKKGTLPQVAKDVHILLKDYLSQAAFHNLLRNPLYKPQQKKEVLHTLCHKRMHETTLTFLQFVVLKRREAHLKAILQQFEELHKIAKHIKTAYLTTAKEISPPLKEKIIAHIQHITSDEEVQLIEKVDPSLIGGYIVKINDQQLDMSIRTQLYRLKTHWEQTSLPDLSNHHTA